jgi:hypothetical protein
MRNQPSLARGNGRDRKVAVPEPRCPTCGQNLSRPAFEAITARLAAEEKARIEEIEQKTRRDAVKAAEAQVRAMRASQEALIAKQVQAARERFEKRLSETIAAEKVRAFEEKARLTEQLADMQRRLEKKTAHERGEPAEVDLYETLLAAFPEDRVSRIGRGQRGPDVLFEVISNGVAIGKIVLDSKAHARWANRFTRKLRDDQLAASAEFGVLSSSAFPAGAKQLHLQDNVIVASPERVPVLIHLLRAQIIQNHTLKLSTHARNEKADRLYSFILSPTYSDMLDQVLKGVGALEALQADEVKDHQVTWKKRAGHTAAMRAVIGQFSSAVAEIISGEAP